MKVSQRWGGTSLVSFGVVVAIRLFSWERALHCDAFAIAPTATTTTTRTLNGSSRRRLVAVAVRENGRLSTARPLAYDGGDFFDEDLDDAEQSSSTTNDDDDDDDDFEEYTDEDFPSAIFEEYIPKLNVVTLSGRVGQEPEPRYFEDGKVVLNLSLAVKRKYHPLERAALEISGDETDWFQLELWGRDAEYAANFVTKGCRVGVTGSLVINNWRDRATGEPRSSPKILCRHFDILETKAESAMRRGRMGDGDGDVYGYGGGGSGGEDDDTMGAGSGGFFD